MTHSVRLLSAAAAALALAACSQEAAQQASTDPAQPAPDPVAAPQDLGRGGMLNARADQIEARVRADLASGDLGRPEADAVLAELNAIRATLADLLAKNTGPLPQADRQLLAERMALVEARARGDGPASAP